MTPRFLGGAALEYEWRNSDSKRAIGRIRKLSVVPPVKPGRPISRSFEKLLESKPRTA